MDKIRIRDAGWKTFETGIRDKHSGSATLMADPYSNPDRDPGSLGNADPDPGFGDNKILETNVVETNISFLDQNLQYFFLRTPLKTLKLEKNPLTYQENMQRFKA
jgi:hypothetical protein